jgi:hypothetical protein
MAASAAQIHHRIPCRLLKVWDRGHGSGLGPEDLAASIEWEEEAYRYGVDPEISREVLAALIEGSTVELGVEDHRATHTEAGDFARWAGSGASRLSVSTGRGGSCSWRVGAGRRSPLCSSKKRSWPSTRGGPSTAALLFPPAAHAGNTSEHRTRHLRSNRPVKVPKRPRSRNREYGRPRTHRYGSLSDEQMIMLDFIAFLGECGVRGAEGRAYGREGLHVVR